MDWKRKLTSRKLWAAIVSFVALLVVALGGTEAQATQITALIMAGATVVAYIIGEGLVDSASAGAAVTINGNPTITGAAGAQAPAEAPSALDSKTTAPVAPAPQATAQPESGAVTPNTNGAV